MEINSRSKAEKLLVAAGDLAAKGKASFTAEDLVVSAWTLFPSDFGLKGYTELHPNANYVLTQLMGKDARMITKGWLEKSGTNRYRLTPKGLSDLRLFDDTHTQRGAIQLDRELEDVLGPLLTSTAYEMWRSERVDEITFHHCCRFFGLSIGDKWQKIARKLAAVRHAVESAQQTGEGGDALRLHFRKRNYSFGPDDLRDLSALHDHLLSHFGDEFDQWRRRTQS